MNRGRASRLLSSFVGAATVACILHATACEEPSHVLEGRFYLQSRDCLGTPSSIDVVSGEDPGTCPPTCLVQRAGDGGSNVYVTTVCGPYAFDFDPSGADPRCSAALAAFTRNDTCQTDGGSSNPGPRDAGSGG